MLDRKNKSDRAIAQSDLHLNAYNVAFYELGLKWYWDVQLYETLLCDSDEQVGIRLYLEAHQPHLLTAYDADFLIDAIQLTKARCYDRLAAPGNRRGDSTNWAEIQTAEIGV